MAERRECPECGRKLDGIMAARQDAPGLFGILRGEAGEALRIFLVVALCVFAVLALLAFEVVARTGG